MTGGASSTMRVLGLSGAQNSPSFTRTLIEAASLLRPPGMALELYDNLGEIPLFDPKLAGQPKHAAISRFRIAVRESDALFLCTHEYRSYAASALENAMKWLAFTGELRNRDLAILRTHQDGRPGSSGWGDFLHDAGARIVSSAELTAFLPDTASATEVLRHPEFQMVLTFVLRGLARST